MNIYENAQRTDNHREEGQSAETLTIRTQTAEAVRQKRGGRQTVDLRLCAFLLYCLLFLILTIFHEPWYDEAQAWQIAKTATLKEILFSIPHYEGHPPFWHLLLLPFAKLGLAYEPCIKGISFVFSAAAMWLLIYRSPLPLALRLSLPFTYFLLYQYGVISRPYCILMLAFFLAAYTYPKRNKKPWPFVLSLFLLCCASSYGIVFAGGIAIAWLVRLHNRKGETVRSYASRIVHSRIFVPLLVLLAAAVLLIILVFPAADANGVNMEDVSRGFLYRFVYMLFIAPIDAMFYQSMGYGALVWQDIAWSTFVPGLLIGIIVFTLIAYFAARCKKLPLFLIPHVLYALFCAKVYFWTHHLGIWLLFLIFFLWCCYGDKKPEKELLPHTERVRFVYRTLAIFCVSVSILWTVTAAYSDITGAYGHGRALADFIRENGLEEYSMMVAWSRTEDEETHTVTDVDQTDCTLGIGVLPYFRDNLFFNFREGTNRRVYSFNCLSDALRSQEVVDYCRTVGMPDIIVGDCYLYEIYPYETYAGVMYTPIASFDDNYIWKNTVYENYYYVYMRKELAAKLGIPTAKLREGDHY